MENIEAIPPMIGPPLIYPIASTCPFIEKKVARTEESGIIVLSQISSSGCMICLAN